MNLRVAQVWKVDWVRQERPRAFRPQHLPSNREEPMIGRSRTLFTTWAALALASGACHDRISFRGPLSAMADSLKRHVDFACNNVPSNVMKQAPHPARICEAVARDTGVTVLVADDGTVLGIIREWKESRGAPGTTWRDLERRLDRQSGAVMPTCGLTGSAHMRLWRREGYHEVLVADTLIGQVRFAQTMSEPPLSNERCS
jgi:hypothetical protein